MYVKQETLFQKLTDRCSIYYNVDVEYIMLSARYICISQNKQGESIIINIFPPAQTHRM